MKIQDSFNYLLERGISARHHTSPRPREAADFLTISELIGTHSNTASLKRTRVLVWSAADEASLKYLIATYQTYFESMNVPPDKSQDAYLEDLAYTLAARRSKLAWKSFALIQSLDETKRNLAERVSTPFRSSTTPSLLLVFTGQGAQYHRMGLELLGYSIFRSSLQRSDHVLRTLGSDWSLIGGFE